MDYKETDTMECSWLGLFKLVKPKRGEKIGIPYADWHHLAILDNYVLLYIWDTREIVDAFPLDVMKPFQAVKIADSGKQLWLGRNTSERARTIVKELCSKYEFLPVVTEGGIETIQTLKENAERCKATVDKNAFVCDDAMSSVFIPKTMKLPDNLFMFKQAPTLNPSKIKLVDATSYLGRAKYYAQIGHAYVLRTIEILNAE